MDLLEERTDRIIDQKTDKADFEYTKKRLDYLDKKLDQKADKSDFESTNRRLDGLHEDMHSQEQHLDRIEAGIGTLKWIIGAEVAVIGVVLAFIKAC